MATLLALAMGLGLAGAPQAQALPDFPPGYPVIGSSGETETGYTVYGGNNRSGTTLFPIKTDPETTQLAYCVELHVSARYNAPGHVGGWDSFLGDNNFATSQQVRERVAWIVYNSYPLLTKDEFQAASGIAGLNEQEILSGTQAAIWHLTDDFVLEGVAGQSQQVTQRVQAVYNYLLSDVNTGRPETSGPTIEITAPEDAGVAGTLVGPIVIEASEATVTVDLVTDVDGVRLVDAAGNAVDSAAVPSGVELFLNVPVDAPAGSASLNAVVEGPETTGLLVSNTKERSQTFMIARSDRTTKEATAAVGWLAQPRIGTTAVDAADGDKYLDPTGEVTVVDTVDYAGLVPGEEYVLEGELMIRGEGGVAIPTGITASKSFTPEASHGSVELRFTVEARDLTGEVIVVFEELFQDGVSVAIHADITDREQTVYRPFISTTAVGDGGGNLLPENGETTITDTVMYSGLHVGNSYRLEGELMTRDGEGNANSTGILATRDFTPETPNGTVDLEFTVGEGELSGETIVVFERLFFGETLIAEHTDIDDDFQTVYRPRIGTSASDVDGGDYLDPTGVVTVVDIVSYSGLEPGHEYTVEGELMVRGDDGEAIATGITASETFTPESPSGTVELSFSIPASELVGEVIVVFEELYREGLLVAVHADINDRGQTVYRPELGTSAADADDGDQFLPEYGAATVVDTVTYSGLNVGQEYTVEGELMLRTDDGAVATGIIGSVTFTPETADGQIDLTFSIPEGELLGEVIVVFEYLYVNGVEVAAHADITDEGQTVYRPAIDTFAYNLRTGDKLLDAAGSTLRDDLSYRGLQPGLTYLAFGEVMLHATGESTGISGQTEFVPEAADGVIHVDFEIPAGLTGETLVVFEWLYLVPDADEGGASDDVDAAAPLALLNPQQLPNLQQLPEGAGELLLLATHTDLNAESQTVRVDTPPEEPPPTEPPATEPPTDAPPPTEPPSDAMPRTGSVAAISTGILAALLALIGGGIAWVGRKRNLS